MDESWNMRKMEEAEIGEVRGNGRAIGANTRSVQVRKSRDDRADMKMLFTLGLDYTYKIASYPETDTSLSFDCPNAFSRALLKTMRDNPKAWSIKDLVEEEIAGTHRERAIKYAVKRLEDQKLIEEVSVPKVKGKRGGRPPKFYKALNVPEKKEGSSMRQLESVSKLKKLDTGTSLNDNSNCQNPTFVKTPKVKTGLDKKEVSTKPIVVEKPSTGTKESFDTKSTGQGVNEWDMWKVDPKEVVDMIVKDQIIDV